MSNPSTNETTEMSAVKQEAVRKAVRLLDTLKVPYKILCPDGTEYGTLEVVKPKVPARTLRNPGLPHGAVTAHLRPYLENLNPGDVARIPTKGYHPESLRSTAGAWLHEKYGKGTYISAFTDGQETLEILRLENVAE